MAKLTSTGTILIIDDEPNLRTSLAMILQRAGHSVTLAASAREAMDYLNAGAYDLAFLDLRMPEIDGLTFLPEIRKQYPDMPVLLLTAYASLESAIDAVRKGARDYLLKPIDPQQILQRVDEIIDEQIQPRRRMEILGELQGLLVELNNIDAKKSIHPESDLAGSKISPNTDPSRIIRRGPFIVDLHARYLVFQDKMVPLSPTAFDYLVTLIRHSPNMISYENLVNESQGYRPSAAEAREMARWRVHELRKAIEDDSRQPRYIITERGTGYRLVT